MCSSRTFYRGAGVQTSMSIWGGGGSWIPCLDPGVNCALQAHTHTHTHTIRLGSRPRMRSTLTIWLRCFCRAAGLWWTWAGNTEHFRPSGSATVTNMYGRGAQPFGGPVFVPKGKDSTPPSGRGNLRYILASVSPSPLGGTSTCSLCCNGLLTAIEAGHACRSFKSFFCSHAD